MCNSVTEEIRGFVSACKLVFYVALLFVTHLIHICYILRFHTNVYHKHFASFLYLCNRHPEVLRHRPWWPKRHRLKALYYRVADEALADGYVFVWADGEVCIYTLPKTDSPAWQATVNCNVIILHRGDRTERRGEHRAHPSFGYFYAFSLFFPLYYMAAL